MIITLSMKKNRKTFALSFVKRYVRLAVWFFGIHDGHQYLRLGGRIEQLQKLNGKRFTVEYLKEAHRLCQHAIAGRPTVCPSHKDGAPRVGSRRGFPLIIPGPLRLLMEAGDKMTIRAVLTVLTVFRIIKYPGTLKLATITDPFNGISEELSAVEVG